MGKLKLKIKQFKKRFKNLSIKKSYTAYMIISLMMATLIAAIIMYFIIQVRDQILPNNDYIVQYKDTYSTVYKLNEYQELELIELDNGLKYIIYDYEMGSSMSIKDLNDDSQDIRISTDKNGVVKELIIDQTIEYYIPVLYVSLTIILIIILPVSFFIACLSCSILFFKYKLNPPLQVLMNASNKISNNELDFTINYSNQDEMGQLCHSFEMMRGALSENQKELWRNIEERKRLNSAFSHDLRTPLTVLKGYSEILLAGLENESIEIESVKETIKTMSKNINRLERYTYEMSRMQKLEEISVHKVEENSQALLNQLNEIGNILCSSEIFSFYSNVSNQVLNIDIELILQVYENLLSNSKRYADSQIIVTCKLENQELKIEVIDDGIGFTQEGLLKATHPFYKEKENVNNTNFGLGLHICRLLTEKHGGDLSLFNHQPHGAKVVANFGRVI